MDGKTGSAVTTYRIKLSCKHPEWILQTKEIYNRVLLFYYDLLLKHAELLELKNLDLLRKLEQKTVTGRDKVPAEIPLPFEKVPVYFRRAAINAAIGQARSFAGLLSEWNQKKIEAESQGRQWTKKLPVPAKCFHASPVLYKGMYKNFSDESILIKLWSGGAWVWVKHTFHNGQIFKTAKILSPTLVVHKKTVMLHIPVFHEVQDIRNVQERVKAGERYCAVSLTSSDVLATCVIFSGDGHVMASKFIRGGKEFAYRRKCLLNKIYKNREKIGGNLEKGENRKAWDKLKNLNDYYAHLISSRIINFCRENGAKIIVVPKLVEGSDGLYGQGSRISFPGYRIIQYLGYKAWKCGVVLTTVRPHYTSNKCNHCREYIKRYNDGHQAAPNYYGGRLFVCPNGHQGNTALNTAKNVGHIFAKKYEFVQEDKVG